MLASESEPPKSSRMAIIGPLIHFILLSINRSSLHRSLIHEVKDNIMPVLPSASCVGQQLQRQLLGPVRSTRSFRNIIIGNEVDVKGM